MATCSSCSSIHFFFYVYMKLLGNRSSEVWTKGSPIFRRCASLSYMTARCLLAVLEWMRANREKLNPVRILFVETSSELAGVRILVGVTFPMKDQDHRLGFSWTGCFQWRLLAGHAPTRVSQPIVISV